MRIERLAINGFSLNALRIETMIGIVDLAIGGGNRARDPAALPIETVFHRIAVWKCLGQDPAFCIIGSPAIVALHEMAKAVVGHLMANGSIGGLQRYQIAEAIISIKKRGSIRLGRLRELAIGLVEMSRRLGIGGAVRFD